MIAKCFNYLPIKNIHKLWWSVSLLMIVFVMTILLMIKSTTPLAARTLGYPDSRVTEVWRKELSTGWSNYASPVVADVLPGTAGLEIVVGGMARTDSVYNHPGGISLLAADGTIIWEKTTYTDGATTYNIGSVWSNAAVGDIDGDGANEIVVGLGGDNTIIDRGGVLALEADGTQKWYYTTGDINYPSRNDGANGIPDGIRSTPALADLDGNGSVEVVISAGDNSMHIINGSTGQSISASWPFNLREDNFSSAGLADIDGDGQLEVVFGGGFGYDDPLNCLDKGGLFRVMNQDATFPAGFNERLDCNQWFELVHGKKVDQVIFSSPAIGDINKDGKLDMAIGSGNYFTGLGYWVKVWSADGTLLKTLTTNGYVDSEPALADLNGDGYLDIIAATEQQATVYAWSGNPADGWGLLPGWGSGVKVYQFNGLTGPIFGSPIVADVDPSTTGTEILVNNGAEVTVLSAAGVQLTSKTGDAGSGPTFWLGNSPTASTPAVADIDNDGQLEIVATGNYWDPPNWQPPSGNPNYKEFVFVWRWPGAGNNAATASLPWPQFRQNAAHLGRVPTPAELAVSNGSGHIYDLLVGGSTAIPGSFTIYNKGDGLLGYDINVSSSNPDVTFNFISSQTGSISSQGATIINYTVKINSLTENSYPTTLTVTPNVGTPQTVVVNIIVGSGFKSVFLPIILKN